MARIRLPGALKGSRGSWRGGSSCPSRESTSGSPRWRRRVVFAASSTSRSIRWPRNSSSSNTFMKLPEAEQLCAQLVSELKARIGPQTAMIGLYTGGAWLAERLHAMLRLPEPLGLMDIAFYRDDYHARGLHHDPKRTKIPFDINGRDLLLVDDVLYTGRTVRAAMNELFDYGRPASIDLAVLIDRGGRELPVFARYSGTTLELADNQNIELKKDKEGRLSLSLNQT